MLNFGGAPIVQAPDNDWNTANNWNPNGQPASVSASSNPGGTYEIIVGSRLRTPVSGNAVFPGAKLVIEGGGVYENNTVAGVGELRIKHNGFNPATNLYNQLVLNGGEVLNGDTGLLVLRGALKVQASSVFYIDIPDNRPVRVDSWLTGAGDIFWHDANTTSSANDFNVTGTTNSFSGQWLVDQGALLGSGVSSLGTNNIIVGTNGLAAAIETLYDVNNPNGNLILGSTGKVYLHQNDHFARVIINGAPLADGIYPFGTLNGAYPVNFPATWIQLNGSAFSSGSGQITVGNGGTTPIPHIIGVGLSGTTLFLSATNGAPGGPWTLLQSTNVSVPLNNWQTNSVGNFDGSGNVSANFPGTATNGQEFYILKMQ